MPGALPHRAPLLLVDRILAREEGRWIRATRALTAGDPLMTEAGVLPAPLLIEAIAQAAALLLPPRLDAVPALLGIECAAFCGEARAGDLLCLYAEISWLRRRMGRAHGRATNGAGVTLCEAEFTFGWMPTDSSSR
jgi:3-hydroxymyristoyl/3-hydroxydecanoyl-(acyl carrier protein) dehydratase